jgi:hypothetical protein
MKNMAFLINSGYKLKIDHHILADGGLLLASAVPMPQLVRKKLKKYPNLTNRYFDPQLYLAGLDANESQRHCANLASYPWFGISDVKVYDSDEQSQKEWRDNVKANIAGTWRKEPPDYEQESNFVNQIIGECIDFQMRIDCAGIILPSPLTHDIGTDYAEELYWLDAGINFIKANDIKIPVFATVALADICLRYSDPSENRLLDLILDVVSAREINGVYLVVEQASEPNETRQIGNTRVLQSALHITHLFKHDAKLMVGVNFFGVYGLALEAAGADFWSCGWYKSLYRLRIADKMGKGYAFPSYWSQPAGTDIHLDSDFDKLVENSLLDYFETQTDASKTLHDAVRYDVPVKNITPWVYRTNNVTAAQDHFLEAVIKAESEHSRYSGRARLDYVENNWLGSAVELGKSIDSILGPSRKTKTEHIQSWYDAFRYFRRDHSV